MKKYNFLVVLAIIGLSGCGSDDKEVVNTVSFYIENEEARTSKVKYCKENAGQTLHDADCINARTANSKVKMAKMLGTVPKAEG